jgi:hypothetical protein
MTETLSSVSPPEDLAVSPPEVALDQVPESEEPAQRSAEDSRSPGSWCARPALAGSR